MDFFEKIFLPRGPIHVPQTKKSKNRVKPSTKPPGPARSVYYLIVWNRRETAANRSETAINGPKCHISACVGLMASPGSARGTWKCQNPSLLPIRWLYEACATAWCTYGWPRCAQRAAWCCRGHCPSQAWPGAPTAPPAGGSWEHHWRRKIYDTWFLDPELHGESISVVRWSWFRAHPAPKGAQSQAVVKMIDIYLQCLQQYLTILLRRLGKLF